MCYGWARRNSRIFADPLHSIYETSSIRDDNVEPGRIIRIQVRSRATPGAVMADLLDFVALSLLPSWSFLHVAERLRAGDPPADALRAVTGRHYRGAPDATAAMRDRAAKAIERARADGIAALPWSDPAYPAALAAILDPPPVLWVRGEIGVLGRPAVAIVGSRAGSAYALAVAERLAADLVDAGLVIVSGLARGVDSAAHRGALVNGGLTIAVLGSGVDVVYPREHTTLADHIEKDGAVISELVPGTPPLKPFFPMRNRIISGLSRAVVVIEAGEKSGSLITARCALEQGRDVLAVPGNVLTGRNRGAHALLRDGAKIVESADDILEELGMPMDRRSLPRARPGAEDPILGCLAPGEPSDLDELAERCGLSPARLLPRLFELEVSGAISRVGGGRFVRTNGRRCRADE